jgi:predicted SprT family Zn-dependent metalloprotease
MSGLPRYLNKYPYNIPMNPEDSQQHRLTRLESAICGGAVGHIMSVADLQEILTNACITYHIKPAQRPKLEIVNIKRDRVYGWQDEDGIYLNKAHDGQNLMTLLHEFAHWVVAVRDYAVEDHGPEFMWILIELFDQYRIIPRECMMLLCDKYMVKVG